MKRILFPLILLASPAFAADVAPKPVPPKPPTCGKTVEDCQKTVDDLEKQLAAARLAYTAVRSQRDSAQSARYDDAVNAYVAQQTAPADAAKESKK